MSIDHILVCGITQSGKSWWAAEIARRAARAGQLVMVYTPNPGDARKLWGPIVRPQGLPQRGMVTGNLREAEGLFWGHSRRALWVFDEAGLVFDLTTDGKRRSGMVTRGRHEPFYHRLLVITQQFRSVAPAVRENCTEMYCFKQGKKSIDAMCEERADEGFRRCIDLPVGHFMAKMTNNDPARYCKYSPK